MRRPWRLARSDLRPMPRCSGFNRSSHTSFDAKILPRFLLTYRVFYAAFVRRRCYQGNSRINLTPFVLSRDPNFVLVSVSYMSTNSASRIRSFFIRANLRGEPRKSPPRAQSAEMCISLPFLQPRRWPVSCQHAPSIRPGPSRSACSDGIDEPTSGVRMASSIMDWTWPVDFKRPKSRAGLEIECAKAPFHLPDTRTRLSVAFTAVPHLD